MTFYEAALRVLESEGRPLHFLEITEKSIQQSLLSHIGKVPEQTMLSRLAAMARRSRDRRVMVTAKDTFALVDWALPEDAVALEQTGVPEENPEEALPPLRPVERHPEPRGDNVRAVGRMDRKRRRDEEEEGRGRKRRFPPLPEVVFEILSEADEALTGLELVERARARELASDELGAEQLLTALLEDNQRRIDAGRRPQFVFSRDTGRVQLERAGAPSEAPPLELQAAFAEALGIPLEGGRPVLRSLSQPSSAESPADKELFQNAKTAVKEARRGAARVLRRRLAELEPGTFEKACVKLLHAFNFRELKVAKRSKEGPLLTARKREGSVELRYAIRLAKGTSQIDRRMVQELRRDLGHYSAQVGLLLGAGDVRGDARGEAQSSGALVMVWGGEALGEKFLEAEVGVSVVRLELFELDERFFETARLDADESARKREERQRQKDQGEKGEREPRRSEPRRASGEEEDDASEQRAASSPSADVQAPSSSDREEDEEEGEGDEDLEAASAFVSGQAGEPGAPDAAPGERKRRRRRRRGRRGRGKDAAPGAEGTPEGGAAQDASAAGASPEQATGESMAPSQAGAEAGEVTGPSAIGSDPATENDARTEASTASVDTLDHGGAAEAGARTESPAASPGISERERVAEAAASAAEPERVALAAPEDAGASEAPSATSTEPGGSSEGT